MGKIAQGILGGVSGIVGNVIGGSWKGIEYVRIRPSSVANPQTPAQLAQRQKFSIVTSFVQPMTEFVKTGFKLFAVKMTGFNAAVSYNTRNAVAGAYPNFTITYTDALVSRGNLAGALNGAAVAAAGHVVNFTWDDNSTELGATATDKSLIVIYNPVKHQAVTVSELVERATGVQAVTCPDSWAGDTVQTYLSFIKLDGSDLSNSSHCGAVIML